MSMSGEKNKLYSDSDPSEQGNEEDEEQKSYQDISALEKYKISIADIKKLRWANYYTVESIAYTAFKELLAIKGISKTKAKSIQEAGI